MKKQLGKKKTCALVRACAAVLAAVVLLAVTGFAFAPLLAGAKEVTDAAELEGAGYVSADLSYILDFCGEEVSESSGKTVAYYAVAPVGGRFVVFRFDAAAYEDVSALAAETMSFMKGESKAMTIHMPVRGMVRECSAQLYSLLNQWFESNSGWMSQSGVIGADPQASAYLSTAYVQVDRLGALPAGWSYGLTVLAAALLVYAVVEGALLAAGRYNEAPAPKAKKEKKVKAEKAKTEAPAAPAEGPAMPVPPAQAPAPVTAPPAPPAEEPVIQVTVEPAEPPENVEMPEPQPAAGVEDADA